MTETASDKSAASANALAEPELHEEWWARYLVDENEALYEGAFDRILEAFSPPPGARILDAGCGTGIHSARLARRGFTIEGVDFSQHAVGQAQANLAEEGFTDQIRLRQADLLALPFEDGEFQYALCWGVLMHVPEVERAISELARVIGRGGKLAISESNMRSVQTLALRAARRILRRSGQDIRMTPAGLEKWRKTATGEMVTRQADIPWLIGRFAAEGLTLQARWAGQFTDVYTRVHSRPLRRAIHRFDEVWFTHARRAGPAVGNILIFERP